MATYNGTLAIFKDPNNTSDTSLNRQNEFLGSYSAIQSVNSPLIHSVLWTKASMTEQDEPLASNFVTSTQKGDVVNVIFDIYQCNEYYDVTANPQGQYAFPNDWTLVASVRKSRDIANKLDNDPLNLEAQHAQIPYGHTFTVDISEICKDLVSYCLLPHGKGTFSNYKYGGLTGQPQKQDNLNSPVWHNMFIVNRNGCYRWIRLQYRAEIIDNNGIVQPTTNTPLNSYGPYAIINHAPDFGMSNVNSNRGGATGQFLLQSGWGQSQSYARSYASNAPNGLSTGNAASVGMRLAKDIRPMDNNEVLYWFAGYGNQYSLWYTPPAYPTPVPTVRYTTGQITDLCHLFFMQVKTYDAAGNVLKTGRLYDWNQNLRPKRTITQITGTAGYDVGYEVWDRSQFRYCAQNVSPVFINANIIHESSTIQDIWENNGTTYTRYMIDTGTTANQKALFINDETAYYSIGLTSITKIPSGASAGAAAQRVQDSMHEYRWYKIDRDRQLRTPQPITSSTASPYYAGVYYTDLKTTITSTSVRAKGFYHPYSAHPPYVKIYWLNKCGGIDSYVFKGNNTKSYTASKNIILKKHPNRAATSYGYNRADYYSTPKQYHYGHQLASGANGNNKATKNTYYNDSWREGDVYRGGREVLSVDATKGGTVTSLPLDSSNAEWLREIISSPNVWTEFWALEQKPGTYYENYLPNRDLGNIENTWLSDGRHPSNFDYIPIIITSEEVDTYDEQKGSVTITLEYIHSHSVVTQRN